MKTLRIVIKTIFLMACVFTFLLLTLSLFLQNATFNSYIKDKTAALIAKKTDYALTFDSLGGWPPFQNHFTNVRLYKKETGELVAHCQDLDVSWDPLALLQHQLYLPKVVAKGVDFYEASDKQQPQDPYEALKKMPLSLHVGKIQATDLALHQKNHRIQNWPSLRGSFGIYPKRHHYISACCTLLLPQLSSSPLEISLSGSKDLYNIRSTWDFTQSKILPKEVSSLCASLHFSAPYLQWVETLQGKEGFLEGDLHLNAYLKTQQMPSLLANILGDDVEGSGKVIFQSSRNVEIPEITLFTRSATIHSTANITNNFTQFSLAVEGDIKSRRIEELPQGALVTARAAGTWSQMQTMCTINSALLKINHHPLECLYAQYDGNIAINDAFETCGELQASGEWLGMKSGFSSAVEYNKKQLTLPAFAFHILSSNCQGQMKWFFGPQALIEGSASGNLDSTLPILPFLPKNMQYLSASATFEALATTQNQQQSLQGSLAIQNADWNALEIKRLNVDITGGDLYQKPVWDYLFQGEGLIYRLCQIERFTGRFGFDVLRGECPFQFQGQGEFRGPIDLRVSGAYAPFACSLAIEELSAKAFNLPLSSQKAFQTNWKDGFFITPFDLLIGEGWMRGSVSSCQDSSHINIDLLNTPLQLLSFIYPHSLLDGELSGSVQLQNEEGLAKGSARAALTSDLILSDSLSPVPLNGDIELDLSSQDARLRSTIYGLGKDPLQVNAQFPLRLSLYPLHFSLNEQAPLSGALQWSGKLEELFGLLLYDNVAISGNAAVSLQAQGTFLAPDIQGYIRIDDGRFDSALSGASLQEIHAVAVAQGKNVLLTEFSAIDGEKGTITATGSIALEKTDHFPYQVNAQLHRALLLHQEIASAAFDGEVEIQGSSRGANIRGNIQVVEAQLMIPKQIAKKVPTVDVTYTRPLNEQPLPPPRAPLFPFNLDLRLQVPKRFFVNGRGLSAEWKGEVVASATPQNPEIRGSLQLIKGEVNLFGRSFTLTQGTITFGGKPAKETHIFVVAQFDVTGYSVKAILQGPIGSPEITFQSSPPLPPTEILSRILFGSGVSQISPLQGIQLANAIMTLSGTFTGPDILGNLQQGLGLDQLTIINADSANPGETVPVLQAGKYLSEGVYVCIDKTLSSDENNVGFEARLSNEFRVRVEVKPDEENTLLLEWRHDY